MDKPISFKIQIYKKDENDKDVYDYGMSKSVGVAFFEFLEKIKKENSECTLKFELMYEQEKNDPSILSPTFKFTEVSEKDILLLFLNIHQFQPDQLIKPCLSIVTGLSKTLSKLNLK